MKLDHPSWIAVPSPNFRAGRKMIVKGMIIHFTAAGSGKNTASYFSKVEVSWKDKATGQMKTAKVSASSHVVIDRDGTVYQCVAGADRAWHAGDGIKWQGQPLTKGQNVNDWTIGIEIANWGKLSQGPGVFKNYLGQEYKGPAPYRHKDGTFWEPYTEAQIVATIAAAKHYVSMYPTITRENVLGHQDVSPHRKIDPGPAWPMERFLDAVFGDDDEQAAVLDEAEDDDRAGEFYDDDAEMCMVDPVKK
jgi:N-acetylmuramoyl-L-alanine amidase